MAISAIINQTEELEKIDKNLCDVHISTAYSRNVCNTVLRKDASYCENIKDNKGRIKCYGLALKEGLVR